MLISILVPLFIAASDPRLNGVHVAFEPLKESVLAGAPLTLDLKLDLDGNAVDSIRAVYVNNDDIKMRIIDSSGKTIRESNKRIWRCEQTPRHIWLAKLDLSATKVARKHLVFSEWCSTNLPPGKYQIECEVAEVGVVKVGNLISERIFLDPPLKQSFSLTVLEAPADAVKYEYEQLLKEATLRVSTVEQQEGIARAVELLAYSQEPLALASQLKLLSGAVEMWSGTFVSCNAIDLLIYLIDLNTPDVAEGLTAAFDDLNNGIYQIRPSSRDFLGKLVLWGIHEMHNKGNPQVTIITEAIVRTHAQPSDPRTIIY